MKHYSIENRLELFQEPLREEARSGEQDVTAQQEGGSGRGSRQPWEDHLKGKEGTHWREVGNNTQTQKEAQT